MSLTPKSWIRVKLSTTIHEKFLRFGELPIWSSAVECLTIVQLPESAKLSKIGCTLSLSHRKPSAAIRTFRVTRMSFPEETSLKCAQRSRATTMITTNIPT